MGACKQNIVLIIDKVVLLLNLSMYLLFLLGSTTRSEQDLLFIESFAGNAEATRSVQRVFPTRTTVALDIKYSEAMDLGSDSGMGNLGFNAQRIFVLFGPLEDVFICG